MTVDQLKYVRFIIVIKNRDFCQVQRKHANKSRSIKKKVMCIFYTHIFLFINKIRRTNK